ncbi:hypothetical protein CAAN3_14S02344 [[Candida] anglica]
MLPEGYSIREVRASDHLPYLESLKVLTTVGEISKSQFEELVEYWKKNEVYHPHVVANEKDEVVATGMLLIERKAIHECGLVGHIEDISVAGHQQGKKLGYNMICTLAEKAKQAGCYKVILDCSPHNVEFYEKCGFKNDGTEMVKRF